VADDDLLVRARGPDGNLGYLFRLAHQAFRARLEDALRPHGLSVPQYGALSIFDIAVEISSAELARLSAVTPQTMNTVVHQLLDKGLLDRRPHPAHGKVVTLRLTRRGRTLLDNSTPAVRAVEHALLAPVNERDAQVIRRWLAGSQAA
jgi:DNA-binding MarR family transcriptional regulator